MARDAKEGVYRWPSLAGPKNGGQRAVRSGTESLAWERRPWFSPQRFTVAGSVRGGGRGLGGERGLLRDTKGIPGHLLPGWELALVPFLWVHSIP